MENSGLHEDQRQYRRAKKKAQNIRSFYINLGLYMLIIPMLIFINFKFTPDFQWFWFSMAGWGIGLCFHAAEVFEWNIFFGKNWEERKIREIIDRENSKNNTDEA